MMTPSMPPPNKGMLGQRAMTVIGMVLAFLQVVEISMPDDTPQWISMLISGLTAAGLAGLGYTHPGRKSRP